MAIIIKTEQQIDAIRKSCQLSADALDHIESFVKIGVSTEEINNEIESFIRKYGAIPAPLGYNGFPKAVCTSLNEVICHGIPSEKTILKDGDILNIDVSTILNGYYGDTCRMFLIGNVSEDAKKLVAVARDCLDIGVTQVKPGNQFCQISKSIQNYANLRGYGVVHQFCGHGVGLKFHEEPYVYHSYDGKNFDERLMKPGMIFTIEPMICVGSPDAKIMEDHWTAVTVDGGLSAQWEHTVLVTDDGVEVLTK